MELSAAAITSLIITALAKISEPAIKLAYDDLKTALSKLFSDDQDALQLPLSKIEKGEDAWISALENSLEKYEKEYTDEIAKTFEKLRQSLGEYGSTNNHGLNINSGNDTYVSQQSIKSVSGESNRVVGQVIKK